MRPDYYRVLGVTSGASPAEIRHAYRTLARREHPDRGGGGRPSAMTLLNEAFETLSDRERRRRYDLLRRVPEPPEVLEAILGAARAALGSGIAIPDGAGDLVLERQGVRASVRLARFAGRDEVVSWLRTAGGSSDTAVLLACRVLDPGEVRPRLAATPFPAAVIDLIESRLFGRFASESFSEIFGVFLAGEKQKA